MGLNCPFRLLKLPLQNFSLSSRQLSHCSCLPLFSRCSVYKSQRFSIQQYSFIVLENTAATYSQQLLCTSTRLMCTRLTNQKRQIAPMRQCPRSWLSRWSHLRSSLTQDRCWQTSRASIWRFCGFLISQEIDQQMWAEQGLVSGTPWKLSQERDWMRNLPSSSGSIWFILRPALLTGRSRVACCIIKFYRPAMDISKERIKHYFREAQLLQYLPLPLIENISDHVSLGRVEPFTIVIEEGKNNDRSFLLVEGRIVVFKRNMPHFELSILDICDNDEERHCFNRLAQEFGSIVRLFSRKYTLLGEQSILTDKAASATLVSKTPLLVIFLDKTLTKIIGAQLKRHRKQIYQFFKGRFDKLLVSNSSIFVENTLKLFSKEIIPKGTVLLRQGEIPSFIHFILKGNCLISKRHKNQQISLAILGEKEAVGLEYLSSRSHYKFTAKSTIEAIRLAANNFKELPHQWIRELLSFGHFKLSSLRQRQNLYSKFTKALHVLSQRQSQSRPKQDQKLTPMAQIMEMAKSKRNFYSQLDPFQVYVDLPQKVKKTRKKEHFISEQSLKPAAAVAFASRTTLFSTTALSKSHSGKWAGVDPTLLSKRKKKFQRKLVVYQIGS